MDQQQSGALGFREVDRDGNPVPPGLEDPRHTGTERSWTAPNPFIVVLWLLAVGLIAGGLAALLGGPMSVGMADRASFEYLVFAFAPQGISGGAAVLLALLFWHAWRWQSRHS
ncbi:hypothetical protein NG819_01600 [Pseudarthrobacter sp. Fe7]|nr:hypothetical protein NG819_01600 [Pseudarthrobacter sp. Fe7]